MAYLNETLGARAIHLNNGTIVLVEPGATAEVNHSKVRRVAPGLVEVPGDLPPVPKDLAKKAKGAGKKAAAPRSELATARAEYKAKFGKQPGPRLSVAAIREKIAAA